MAGIYIHIPFCKQACIYCNFHFSTVLKNKEGLLQAILQEMEIQSTFFEAFPSFSGIDTLYFGGGTPSLLTASEIKKLIARANAVFHLKDDAEITLEGNPDDLTLDKLQSLKSAGINRLSIGVQSFFDEDLQWMNRAHRAKQALACLQDARTAGFSNFSADLIFGIPGMTDARWEKNIQQMIALDVPHLSCYALTLESKTPLDYLIKNKQQPPLDEDQSARQFEMLMQLLNEAGYEQYEISNFAKPGHRSRHNSSYWKNIPYLGIGPAAHSFRPGIRQWNVSNNALYIKNIHNGIVPAEKESLTPTMQLDEYLLTSLRTIEGCDLDYIEKHFGKKKRDRLFQDCQPFLESGKMLQSGSHLVLSTKGKLFADGIAAELFE